MDDREFFDHLFQMWTKTTHASDRYWDYEEDSKTMGLRTIRAVGENGEHLPVAWGLYEKDADWITAVHGCFGDLVRRLNSALDEADRADYERDSRECRIGELELEVDRLKSVVEKLSQNPPWNNR